MKFQDSSFNGLKVTVSTKKCDPRTHPRTHAPKAICPINFFKVGGINISNFSTHCQCLLEITVTILSFRTDRSGQAVQTQIRLLLEEQSDQGLYCLLIHLLLLDEIP